MTPSSTRSIILTAKLLLTLSTCSLLINLSLYHFPGNNYFPPSTIYVGLSLLLMHCGFSIYFGSNSQFTKHFKEIVYFFLVMSVIALATNAAQYTPFPTIDKHILSIEQSFHINIKSIVSWTDSSPQFKRALEFIYDTLPYQMAYLPLLIITTRRLHYIREYYFFLLISATLGFTFYYFFPTSAPASIIDSGYFSAAQKATGLKFTQIHHYIQPTTIEGGMIAFPSFHTIWAWFCLYLLRGFPILFMMMLPVNTLLIASCVLLGWHYPTDILGGIVIIIISHGMYHFCHLSPASIHHTQHLEEKPDLSAY